MNEREVLEHTLASMLEGQVAMLKALQEMWVHVRALEEVNKTFHPAQHNERLSDAQCREIAEKLRWPHKIPEGHPYWNSPTITGVAPDPEPTPAHRQTSQGRG